MYQFVLLCSLAVLSHCDEPFVNSRQGKIFDPAFWQGIERGFSQSTDEVLSRVQDNLEVAVDQLSSSLDRVSKFSDTIEDRVQDSLPPFLRSSPTRLLKSNAPIEAVMGTVGGGDGVDDGLNVYYEGDDTEHGDLEGATSEVSNLGPLPEGLDTEVVSPVGPSNGFEDHHFGIGLQGSWLNPFGNFGPFGGNGPVLPRFPVRRQWWKGPNVCIDREEIDEPEQNEGNNSTAVNLPSGGFMFGFSNMEYSSCSDAPEKYSCVTKTSRRGIHKTVKTSYRCCHGFIRDLEGCIKVDLRKLPEALDQIGTTDFLTMIKSAGLVEELTSKNFTLFVPTNEAIEEFTEELQEKNNLVSGLAGSRAQNEVYRRRRSTHELSPTLRSHMVEGFLYAGDIFDEQILTSNNDNSTIRMNTYSSYPPTVTANCARIITANQHATNGVLHTIDRVLKPVTKSLGEIINSDPRFTILNDLVSKAELNDLLQKDGQFTIFAPTDAAFRALPAHTLEAFLLGNSCLEAVLKNHILPNVICSAAIQGKARTLNLLKDYVFVERDGEDTITVQDAKMVDRDVVGTNGVIHVIDKPLMPEEAQPVLEVLESHNLTRFIELLEAADMIQELQTLNDVTVFAPSNAAIDAILEEDMNAMMDNKEELKNMLKYHMTTSALEAHDINNNHVASTRSGHPLRINLYSGIPLFGGLMGGMSNRPVRLTAGCSRVSVLNSRACGAVVHIIDDALEVPKDSVMEKIKGEGEYSLFKQMIEDIDLAKTLSSDGPFTILAPSDHVLKVLPEEELKAIMDSQEIKEAIVKRHIMNEHLCCSGINANTWPFMDRKRTLDGSAIHVRRTNNGRLMADRTRITRCGSPAHNGVVHTVNNLMVDIHPSDQQPELVRRPPKNTLQFLFG